MKSGTMKILTLITCMVMVCVGVCGCSDGGIRALLTKAKAAENDGNVNFFGFYTGMPMTDAETLATHYGLDATDSFLENIETHEVCAMHFSLQDVRRLAKGGNTLDELAQSVTNQSFQLQRTQPDTYAYENIFGVSVTLSTSNSCCLILDAPRIKAAEQAFAAKEKAEWEAAVADARENLIPNLSSMMVDIPGGHFKMGKYEVTRALWTAVMGNNPSGSGGADLPVEHVSWDDAKEFCRRLNALTPVVESGLKYRLPTETEWVYACGAGSKMGYCKIEGGREIEAGTLGEVAWYENNGESYWHPVGQKKPNAWGLYDMHGNVAEWTATGHGEDRVVCGGNCFSSAEECKSDQQVELFVALPKLGVGFRLAAVGPDEREQARKAAMSSLLSDMIEITGENYLMCKHECTQALWEAVMDENPSSFYGADSPVEQVGRNDILMFLRKLNAQPEVQASGLTFRLPTEAEWRYACRAGSRGDYCKVEDGGEIAASTLGGVAWYTVNSRRGTHSVGQKLPNAWGLYDMHGNVSEWTSTPDGAGHVCLGGSWKDSSSELRVSYRQVVLDDDRDDERGFRLAAIDPVAIAEAERRAAAAKAEAEAQAAAAEAFAAEARAVQARAMAERKAAAERRAAEVRAAAERDVAEGLAEAERRAAKVRAARERADKLIASMDLPSLMLEIPRTKFKLCKYEVTQEMWEAVMGVNPSEFKGATRPVENVSRDDCLEFLKRLNALPSVKASGLVYRLPMEAEWEYACRAGSKVEFCKIAGGGEIARGILGEVAWYGVNSGHATHPVGQKKPNAFGLYDMHGNVEEWTVPTAGMNCVGRGGSWNDSAAECGSSIRHWYETACRRNTLGLRLAATKP